MLNVARCSIEFVRIRLSLPFSSLTLGIFPVRQVGLSQKMT